MSEESSDYRQRWRQMHRSSQIERTPEEVDALIDELIDEIVAENEAKWAEARKSVIGILKRWRPNSKWLCNDICQHWSSDGISVDVMGGDGQYTAQIVGVEGVPTQMGKGASSQDAVYAAYINVSNALCDLEDAKYDED